MPICHHILRRGVGEGAVAGCRQKRLPVFMLKLGWVCDPQGAPDPFLSQHPPPNLGVSLSLCLLSHLQSPGWPCELPVWFPAFWHAVFFTLLAAYLRGARLIFGGSKSECLSWAKCNGQHARELRQLPSTTVSGLQIMRHMYVCIHDESMTKRESQPHLRVFAGIVCNLGILS